MHEHAQPLMGYRGDQRSNRAHVIIRRKHVGRASNHIGFEHQPDGHAYHATAKTLAAQGFDLVSEDQDRDGTVRMVLRRVR